MGITAEMNHPLPSTGTDNATEDISVFISYRREDSAGFTRAIEGELTQALGKDKVFIDVDDIIPGTDYQDHIHKSIYSCDVLVVIIGQNWNLETSNDTRRLDNPKDWVRQEIAIGLNRNIKVIPVLLDGVDMPDKNDLPEELEKLTRYEAIEITNTQFKMQSNQLIKTVRDALKRTLWNIIKLWVMRKRVLVLCTMTVFLAFTFFYHEKIHRITLEHSADTLRSIGLFEEDYISEQFNDLGVRDLTILLYKEALEHVQDDVHKAKIMMKLALQYDMHHMHFQSRADYYFQQARGLLDSEIDRNVGNPDVYLARAELLSQLGASIEGGSNYKDAEELYTSAIEDYQQTYNDIERANNQSRQNYAELNYSLAMIMRKQEQYSKAKEYFDESLRMYGTLEPSRQSLDVAQAFVSMLKIYFKAPNSAIEIISSS